MIAAAGRRSAWHVGAWLLAAFVSAPLVAVGLNLLLPRSDVWRHLSETILWELTWNTAWLLVGVGIGAGTLGTSLAWLTVTRRFPGRRIFEWALMLPLAIPAYVMGFVFLALLEYSGPVQSFLRASAGNGLLLPDVRSGWGLVTVLSLVLYPYPYLMARSAFGTLGASPVEAARSLGLGPRQTFWRVALPLARPAIGVGVALALMEALADFGTVSLFDYRTYTVGIYRVWFGMFDRAAAGQLSVVLLLWAFALFTVERTQRRRRRYTQAHGRRAAEAWPALEGWRAWLATAACFAVLSVAFLIPLATLVSWSLTPDLPRASSALVPLAVNSLSLAALAAILCVAAGLLLAYARRRSSSRGLRVATQLAGLGYAMPGSVVAVGVLAILSGMDRTVADLLQRVSGRDVGLLATSTGVGLLFAYLVRFIALGFHPTEAGLSSIPRSLDESAASLGATPGRLVRELHLPLLRAPLTAAALLVFLDVMKELPATMLIRPLGWDTLAVGVWQMTTESLWRDAALPSLAIVAAGLPAVIALIHLGSSNRTLGATSS
jgi:iron(III) transport system permease protein